MSAYSKLLARLGRNRDLYPDDALNVVDLTPPRLGEGVGFRACVFCQGCARFCPGCRNLAAGELRIGELLPADALVKRLTTWRTLRLPTERYDADAAYRRLLWANTLASLLWEATTAPRQAARLGGIPIAECCDMMLDVHERLKPLALCAWLRGDPTETPAAWPEMPVRGVTFTGGEPMMQARTIETVVERLRRDLPDWDIWLYTGLSFEEIMAGVETRRLLGKLDVVKSGAFTWKKRDRSHLFFGSSNQLAIDAPRSLAAREPVPYDYPDEIAACLAIGERAAREGLAPEPTPEAVGAFRAFLATKRNIHTIDELESHFGTCDESLPERLFAFKPRHRRLARQAFLPAGQVNIHGADVRPGRVVEGGALTVWLQGSAFPPAADAVARVTDLRPHTLREPESLLDEALGQHNLRLRCDLDHEAALHTWLNIALQLRFFRQQRAYYLRRSPRPDLDLASYSLAISRYLKQLRRLFNRRHGWPLSVRAVFIRGGDPLLQPEGVNALCRAARDRGLEVWVELPYRWDRLQLQGAAGPVLAEADFAVCGQPHDGQSPWVHPFLTNRRQRVIRIADGAPWRPRFEWSQQLAEFADRFANDQAIARARMSAGVIRHFGASATYFKSLETLEAAVGRIRRPWSTGRKS